VEALGQQTFFFICRAEYFVCIPALPQDFRPSLIFFGLQLLELYLPLHLLIHLPRDTVSIMAHTTEGGNAAFHNFNNDFAHIADPNERRRLALAEIDKAPFGWYHIRAIVVAGIGFFTDSYDIFAINMVTAMLGVVYWQDATKKPGTIPSSSDTAIKVATSGGTVIGQVGFGWLADQVGRKKMYGLELILIIFATLAQSLSSSSSALSIVGVLIFWRVMMGIGIGGDYPLSSIITSE
jgi:MFS transporter, PHS family, inorganic phosphate transporter